MQVNRAEKVFFYCCPSSESPEEQSYQDLLLCIGEGLKELGVEFYSDVNYWRESPEKKEYIFRPNPKITPDDCSIVVLDGCWFQQGRPFPQKLFHPNRKYVTVYIDGNDGDKTEALNPEFRQFDFIFRTHYNSKLKYPSNYRPWAFGLSNRVIKEIEIVPNFSHKRKQIIVNYRPYKKGHSVRNISFKEFLPRIQKILPINDAVDALNSPPSDPYNYLHWLQTGKRHYPSYYNRLKESAACASFGGFFVPPLPKDPSTLISRIVKRILNELNLKSNRIVQWDSWRFWESLASGCATFHVDFEKYGVAPPVMPENWRHYIGIDLDNIQEAIDKIANDPDILERIAIEGRLWALKHYSPVPTAQRFLEIVSKKIPFGILSERS